MVIRIKSLVRLETLKDWSVSSPQFGSLPERVSLLRVLYGTLCSEQPLRKTPCLVKT